MNRFGRHTRTVYLLIAGMLALALTAQAQDRCSLAMARGTYAIECRGETSLGTDDHSLLPAVALGTVFLDGEGNLPSGMMDVSIGGVASQVAVSGGVGIVNPDCTSAVDLTLGELVSGRFSGVMLNQGATIMAFSPIPGITALCTLNRISLD